MNATPKLLLHLALLAAPLPLRAEISEPDNVLYGTIVIGTEFVTAARADVVLEARRNPTGPAVATYRMGSNPALGDFYALRIPVEARGPVDDPNASLAGEQLHIVLTDASGVQGQGTYTIPERGAVQRVDFGAPISDSDQNGLPDAWELARFGSIGQNPALDPDGDGLTTGGEWIAGTDPRDPSSRFELLVSQVGGATEVSFVALRAEGPGYEGKTRVYSILSSTNLGTGVWTGRSGFTNLVGNNALRTLPVTPSAAPRDFFRGQVDLVD